ncbi:hypothetical protein LEP1GSC112_0046 [Leptospira interrogans serovar Pomona str. UT364]|nr:hypothetical protein LEP1GSC112_0046 [Leptospira interrogans serovar Pomona str. UT364]
MVFGHVNLDSKGRILPLRMFKSSFPIKAEKMWMNRRTTIESIFLI